MFEKDMSVCDLIDTYGNLLSQNKLNMITLYYNEDYSLSEIAEICGLSRQGVRDSIKKSEAELKSYEDRLHLVSKIKEIESFLNEIKPILDQQTDPVAKDLKDRLDALSL